MKTFAPYAIHHIQLSSSLAMPALETNDKGNYLVFWWKEIGLGQIFIEPGKPFSEKEYKEQLLNAVTPTIEFYLKGRSLDNVWEQRLVSGDIDGWNAFMETLFAQHISVQVPASVPVSVVICTRNRAAHLQQCLASLKVLSCVPEEIIVVDNAPVDDSTKNVAEKFDGVKYIKEARPGLDYARNTGILNSTCPVVAFTDDDVRVAQLWVYRVWETFQDQSVGAMTGLIIAAALETKAQFIFEKYWSFNRGYVDKIYDETFFNATLSKGPPVWEIGAGANMAFRRSVFEKTGFFNELLDVGTAGCNGDSEMWFRILSNKFSIYYNPRAIVYHEHRQDLEGLKKQIFYYMRGFTTAALIQQKLRPDSGYIKYKLRKFPLYYRNLLIKAFPRYSLRFSTLGVEIRGILSGLKYYKENRHRFASATPKATPLVSIIIPCFNHGKYLLDAVKSVWAQDYQAIEVIVVDDGSTDDTAEIAKEIPGIKYIYQKNKGLSAARNTGIKNSKGDFLIFLDADDWLLPGAIATNLKYLIWSDALAFVSGAHEKFFVESGESLDVYKEINENHYFYMLQGNYIGMNATVMFRRWVFDDFLFDESLKACEDYDIYLRVARKFPVFHHNVKIAAYRIHSTNMSGNIPLMQSTALNVLKRQKDSLQTAEEQEAYESGLKIWEEYYS